MDPTEQIPRLLQDGLGTLCVFENHDLGHPEAGRRVALVYWDEDAERMKIGTPGPDHADYGPGWRYVLIAKTKDPVAGVTLIRGH